MLISARHLLTYLHQLVKFFGRHARHAVICRFDLDLSLWPLLLLKTSRFLRACLNCSGLGNPGWRVATAFKSVRICISVSILAALCPRIRLCFTMLSDLSEALPFVPLSFQKRSHKSLPDSGQKLAGLRTTPVFALCRRNISRKFLLQPSINSKVLSFLHAVRHYVVIHVLAGCPRLRISFFKWLMFVAAALEQMCWWPDFIKLLNASKKAFDQKALAKERDHCAGLRVSLSRPPYL